MHLGACNSKEQLGTHFWHARLACGPQCPRTRTHQALFFVQQRLANLQLKAWPVTARVAAGPSWAKPVVRIEMQAPVVVHPTGDLWQSWCAPVDSAWQASCRREWRIGWSARPPAAAKWPSIPCRTFKVSSRQPELPPCRSAPPSDPAHPQAHFRKAAPRWEPAPSGIAKR